MMKWLHFYYNERGFWIHVSVVVSQELSLYHSGVLAKISNGILKSPIPSQKLDARFSKLFSEVFCVFPEKFFSLHLVAACPFTVAGIL